MSPDTNVLGPCPVCVPGIVSALLLHRLPDLGTVVTGQYNSLASAALTRHSPHTPPFESVETEIEEYDVLLALVGHGGPGYQSVRPGAYGFSPSWIWMLYVLHNDARLAADQFDAIDL